MKKIGIVAEFNPFHNGHKYIIEKAVSLSGADASVVMMSPDFVQRGEPSIFDMHLRAKLALKYGADAVFALPCCYALSSSGMFAKSAVMSLYSLGIRDIAFGTEIDDIDILYKAADILLNEPEHFTRILKDDLRAGMSYPAAKSDALCRIDESLIPLFKSPNPNSTLAIEYIKTSIEEKLDINFYPIRRIGQDYEARKLDASLTSATAIREHLREMTNSAEMCSSVCHKADDITYSNVHGSECCKADIKSEECAGTDSLNISLYENCAPLFIDDFSVLFFSRLIGMNSSDLQEYLDVDEEIANLIIKYRSRSHTITGLIKQIKSKSVAYSRISRCLMHILLDIKEKDMFDYIDNGIVMYNRLIGVRKEKEEMIREFIGASSLPIVINNKDRLKLSNAALNMFEHDIFSAELYETVLSDKYRLNFNSEASRKFLCL